MSFYVIETEYVGPNKQDSEGHWIGDTWHHWTIQTEPGRTNMSNEPREDGWLGTSNDWHANAHGRFDTLDAARQAVRDMAVTDDEAVRCEPDDDDGPEVVERWITAEAAREQWGADDWFHSQCSHNVTCDSYNITATTTDEELFVAGERAIDEARENNAEVHGTLELFTQLRDELKELAEEDD